MDELIKAQSELNAELKLLAEALKDLNDALNITAKLGKETAELVEAHINHLQGNEGI